MACEQMKQNCQEGGRKNKRKEMKILMSDHAAPFSQVTKLCLGCFVRHKRLFGTASIQGFTLLPLPRRHKGAGLKHSCIQGSYG